MITDILILAIYGIAIIQGFKYSWIMAAPAIVYASVNLIFSLFLSGYGDGRHFLIGAVLAGIIRFIISLCRKNLIAIRLQLICIFDIVLNINGWILYENGAEPFFYDMSFIALYAVVLIILIRDGGINGIHKDNRFGGYFFPDFNKRHFGLQKFKTGI